MMHLSFSDFVLINPILIGIIAVTGAYFKFNTTTSFVKSSTKDKKIVRAHVSKKNYNFGFIRFIICILALVIFQLLTYHGSIGAFWCNHLYVNNFTYKYMILFYKIALFVFLVLYNLTLSRVYFSVDYIYSVAVIFFLAPLLFLSNNFFVFYFILELIVCLTFFKFTVSRFWYKSSVNFYTKSSSEKFADYCPKMFLNSLFFQYWVSFFSSILLLYFFINLEFYFCSTEWTFLNFANNFADLPASFYVYFFLFIAAFFLKLGITPFHLYKVEVYKGLPYISLYIYTVLFFFIYFFYFTYLFLTHLSGFVIFYWFSLVFCVVLGLIYVISMLFDVNFIKSFFAYSTIINALSFIIVLISNF